MSRRHVAQGLPDGDADGQVGLYEWRMGGKPTAKFVPRDGDGDLMAGEWPRQA